MDMRDTTISTAGLPSRRRNWTAYGVVTTSPKLIPNGTCDGAGTAVMPGAEGPDYYACDGCSACTPRRPARTGEQVAAAAKRAAARVFAAESDDEPF